MSGNNIAYCRSCKNRTKHNEIFKKIVSFYLDEYVETYSIIECAGCETISFKQTIKNNFLIGLEPEKYISEEELVFPGELEGHKGLEYSGLLPEKIRLVYDQTLLAFKGKSFLLTGIGFRAIIEAICIEEKITGSNLEKKIDKLSKNRLITEKEAERLHSIRFLGNDSIHEMDVPRLTVLFLVLGIIENLLSNLYLIDWQAKQQLDTIIKSYTEFELLVWQCSTYIPINEEKTLTSILGKHIRRLRLDIKFAEKKLIERINNNEVKFLKLGSIKSVSGEISNRQYYIFTGLMNHEPIPF